MLRRRGAAIIIHRDCILLIGRRNSRGEYFIFPGGGLEPGESYAEATCREIKEELGVEIVNLKLFYKLINHSQQEHSFFFTAHLKNELDATEEALIWREVNKQQPDDLYLPKWVNVTEFDYITLYPHEAKKAILMNWKFT